MSNPDPLVTVVIPAFDAEDLVGGAVDSVLRQTYPHLELFVVDDGSRDGTAARAQRPDDDRVTVMTITNRGSAGARNVGLEAGRGELVAFLDADDYWDPTRLERQVPMLMADPSIEVVGHRMRYESLRSDRQLGISGQPVDEAAMEDIRTGRLVPFPLSSALCRTATVREVGAFDASLDHAEDLDLFVRLARRGRFVTIDEPLGAYRVHHASLSASRFADHRMQARFIRARVAARNAGGDLEYADFARDYRPTLTQRHDDLVRRLYRNAGVAVAERQWVRAACNGSGALVLGPRFTLRRLRAQQSRQPSPSRNSS